MDLTDEYRLAMTRRHFFARNSVGIGTAALASLLGSNGFGATVETKPKTGGLPGLPHFPPKAKRVIFLHQSGGPSQMDLFDYKPNMRKMQGTDPPRPAHHRYDLGAKLVSGGQPDFQVQPIWPIRNLGERVVAAPGQGCG